MFYVGLFIFFVYIADIAIKYVYG